MVGSGIFIFATLAFSSLIIPSTEALKCFGAGGRNGASQGEDQTLGVNSQFADMPIYMHINAVYSKWE